MGSPEADVNTLQENHSSEGPEGPHFLSLQQHLNYLIDACREGFDQLPQKKLPQRLLLLAPTIALALGLSPVGAEGPGWNPLEHDDNIHNPPLIPPAPWVVPELPTIGTSLENANIVPPLSIILSSDTKGYENSPSGKNGTAAVGQVEYLGPPIADPQHWSLIDFLVVYANRALNYLGSREAVVDRANLEADLLNQTQRDSFLELRTRLVGVEYVDLPESSDPSEVKNTVQDSEAVWALRDQYGADLVLMFSDIIGCGIANLMTPDLYGQKMARWAYAVYDVTCVPDQNYTVAHEFGHIWSLLHSDETGGVFAYGRGYRVPGGWRDIMATTCPPPDNCPAVGVYSSPHLAINGQEMGTTDHDARRASNEIRFEVENFRPTRVLVVTRVKGGVVKDATAVPLATVIVDGVSGVTDDNGSYEIDVPPGSYTVRAMKEYGDIGCFAELSVIVDPGQIVKVPYLDLGNCILLKKTYIPVILR